MDDREVGRRIAHWRRRRGLTQALFADRVGTSKSWVEKVEAGRRRAPLAQLEQVAAVLRLELNEVRCRSGARGVIADRLRRARGAPLDLAWLAERAGVSP